jgi:hypothetical protein
MSREIGWPEDCDLGTPAGHALDVKAGPDAMSSLAHDVQAHPSWRNGRKIEAAAVVSDVQYNLI